MNNGRYNVIFSLDSLKQMKKEMLESATKLEESCKECYRKIDDSKRVYTFNTGNFFREKANEFVLKNQSYMVDVVIPFINQLDFIIAEYENELKEIETSVKGKVN